MNLLIFANALCGVIRISAEKNYCSIKTRHTTQAVVSKTYSKFLDLRTLKNRPRRSHERVSTDDQDHFLAQIAKEVPQHPTRTFKGNLCKPQVFRSKLLGEDFALEKYLGEDN